MTAKVAVHPEASAVPEPWFGLHDPHHTHHLRLRSVLLRTVLFQAPLLQLGFAAVMQGRDRTGDAIEFIAIGLFEHVLLLAEDAAPQGPVPRDQGRIRTQQVKAEPIRTGGGRQAEIVGVDADTSPHRRGEQAGGGAEAAADATAAGIQTEHHGQAVCSNNDSAEQAPHLAQPADIASERRSPWRSSSATPW